MGLRGHGPRPIGGSDRVGKRGVCYAAGDLWVSLAGGDGEDFVGKIGGFSHEGEHDLALMVTDFLENGSGGGESRWCSSDSDSGIPDLAHLADVIPLHKQPVERFEIDLLAVVQSLMLCINESDLYSQGDGQCNFSCIRKSLVKLLRVSGYDASICISKWQGSDKVPGGDHEYIDVLIEGSERLIVDIDFRSHFEIARAVESYDAILRSLPVVYVGSWNRLQLLLQVMVEAARISLKQNSMPLPPWRSLGYLQAKWLSKSVRKSSLYEQHRHPAETSYHKQCVGHLRRLKSALQSEIESESLLKPMNSDKKRRMKLERRKAALLKV